MAIMTLTLSPSGKFQKADTDQVETKKIKDLNPGTSTMLLNDGTELTVFGTAEEIIKLVHDARSANGEWAETEW